jgi:MFS family permease
MQTNVQHSKLFLASRIALIFTAMTFALRASLEGVWGDAFHLTKEELGWIFSPAFWGFTLAMIFGGPLALMCSGMKKLLVFAFIGHVAGVIIYLIAKDATMLFIGTACIGVGNGMVEAACNPLVVTLYPNNKTTMLNRFHVWFPGGIVVGGLTHIYLSIHSPRLAFAGCCIVYTGCYLRLYLFFKLDFPQTERVTKGISFGQMLKACLSPYCF